MQIKGLSMTAPEVFGGLCMIQKRFRSITWSLPKLQPLSVIYIKTTQPVSGSCVTLKGTLNLRSNISRNPKAHWKSFVHENDECDKCDFSYNPKLSYL